MSVRSKYSYWAKTKAKPFLLESYGNYCFRCLKTNVPLDIDHIKPRHCNQKLKMDLDNLQFLCRPCHIHKTHKEPTKDYRPNVVSR